MLPEVASPLMERRFDETIDCAVEHSTVPFVGAPNWGFKKKEVI